jgi:hypothetical protein
VNVGFHTKRQRAKNFMPPSVRKKASFSLLALANVRPQAAMQMLRKNSPTDSVRDAALSLLNMSGVSDADLLAEAVASALTVRIH